MRDLLMKAENIGTPLNNPNKSCNFVFILILGLRNTLKWCEHDTITSGNVNLFRYEINIYILLMDHRTFLTMPVLRI